MFCMFCKIVFILKKYCCNEYSGNKEKVINRTYALETMLNLQISCL